MKYQSIYFILMALSTAVFSPLRSQTITLIDATDHGPIPYATAEWIGFGRGVVADAEGLIDVTDFPSNARFHIRSIGYQTCFKSLDSVVGDTVHLRPSVMQLNEVVVRPLSPMDYIIRAMRKVKENYSRDSFATQNYYQEKLIENDAVISHIEAFVEVKQPGYRIEKDSFEVRIRAAKEASSAQLTFMNKELQKSRQKDHKKAKKEGRVVEESELDAPLELGSPPLLLYMDPLRHSGEKMSVNDHNVQFLDSSNTEHYTYWFGTPVQYGERSLVVIHFDQKEKVHKAMFSGTIWIDAESDALTKISFGLSERGMKYLTPGYVKAALWLYGLNYDIEHTLFEFNYAPFVGGWRLQSTRLEAKGALEKRRLFGPNDFSEFSYKCEMITTRTYSVRVPFSSEMVYQPKELLSGQLKNVSEEQWNDLKRESRNFY
ncbi:MAG: hypothetical protein RLP15_11295 [Cryomorphaceae bacterium]